jgi:hypothetical protein
MGTWNLPYHTRVQPGFGPRRLTCGYVYTDESACGSNAFDLVKFSDGLGMAVCHECGAEYTLEQVLTAKEKT